MSNIVITTPVLPIWNIVDSSPTAKSRFPARLPCFPQKQLIEISMHDKFAKSIILASLLCGSGKVC